MKGLLGSVAFVLCIATVGCGSSSGKKTDGGGGTVGSGGNGGTNGDASANGASCSTFTACGGNIVGTWHLVASCGFVPVAGCSGVHIVTTAQPGSQITYTFDSSGTFTYAFSGGVTEMLRYPIGCLSTVTDAGIPQACADYQRSVQAVLDAADGGTTAGEFTGFTCAAEGSDTCLCSLGFTYAQQTQSGSYAVSGNRLIGPSIDGGTTDAGADASWEYCVSGNMLALHGTNSTGADWVLTFTR